MKKDIHFPKIEDVFVTIVQDGDIWNVYLLNRHQQRLETVMVTSKGYGKKGDEEQRTSTLRHMIPRLEPGEYALIEPITDAVFHLNNEYWVSFFINGQLYDKKYIFVPDTIVSNNLTHIAELGLNGVLHG